MPERGLADLLLFLASWALVGCLLALALLARRLRPGVPAAHRERWLKAALLVAPLGAAAQIFAGGAFSTWSVPLPLPPAATASSGALARDGAARVPAPPVLASELAGPGIEVVTAGPVRAGVLAVLPAPAPSATIAPALRTERVLVGVWAVLVLAAIAGTLRRSLRLRSLLRGRAPVRDGLLFDELARLQHGLPAAARVRASTSDELGVPIAFGILRPEICVPARLVAELSRPELRALLAHELAHLLRRDPLWLALCRVQSACLPFHPLLAAAARALREDAELACDEWAARRSSQLDVARCLTRVAARALDAHEPGAALAMASREPLLSRRVAALLTSRRSEESAGRESVWRRALPIAACALLVSAVPALRRDLAAAPTSLPSSGEARSRGVLAELRSLEQELGALRVRVDESTLAAELAPSLQAWETRVAELSAELAELVATGVAPSSASLPPSASPTPSR